jgi:predicted RNA-binding Zn-ribbon protein involved in translation (DUF1610 family)
MSLKQPGSIEECLYFTRRDLANNGNLFAWVYKKMCPKCGKAKMGKPVEKGKVKIRAEFYVCPNCNFTEQEIPHEESCMIEVVYKCPKCGFEGEATAPYKRKKIKMFDDEKMKNVTVDAFPFECSKCHERILITKKLK